jgi:hypothetical protein
MLNDVQWENLLKGYCPFLHEEFVIKILQEYSGHKKFGESAQSLLDASKKCLSLEK